MTHPSEQFPSELPQPQPERELPERAPPAFAFGGCSPEGVMVLDEVIAKRYYSYTDADRPAALTSLYGAIDRGRTQLITDDPFNARRLNRLMAASSDERVQRQAMNYSLELLRYDQTSPDSHPFATLLFKDMPYPEPEGDFYDRVKVDEYDFTSFEDIEEIALLNEVINDEREVSSEGGDDEWAGLMDYLGEAVENGIIYLVEYDTNKARELLYAMAMSNNLKRQRSASYVLGYLLKREHDENDIDHMSQTTLHLVSLFKVEQRELDFGNGARDTLADALFDGWLPPEIDRWFREEGRKAGHDYGR